MASGRCYAGTSSPFDIGPLLAILVLYLLGLIVCIIMILVAKRNGFWLNMLCVGIGLPIVLFYIASGVKSYSVFHQKEEISEGTRKNLVAFNAYCRDRQRSVSARVAVDPGTALVIFVDDGFPLRNKPFDALPLRDYMRGEPSNIRGGKWCERSGIGSLVGRHDRTLRQFEMCSEEQGTLFTGELPRYVLILGAAMDATPAPWRGEQISMYKSPIRLVDRHSGTTLAKDTMYLLRYEDHAPGCPDGNEQIASLIAEVFPKQ
ncbi:hypothetical protein [Massilia phyllosphaerae]|uniref:hypothetical protein n=1 Tax=Massilia phyllosphaerae TaxID=3106034 RepID=UPI002B1CAE6B|nr:hypothetical protein [Massilia sp. SGZ-792]